MDYGVQIQTDTWAQAVAPLAQHKAESAGGALHNARRMLERGPSFKLNAKSHFQKATGLMTVQRRVEAKFKELVTEAGLDDDPNCTEVYRRVIRNPFHRI